MTSASDILRAEPIAGVLAREHERARGDDTRLAAVRSKLDAARADGTFNYDLFPKDVYLSIEPAMGDFLYLAAKAIGAKTIVEFGTSFGISTIYLAAAARETGGHVIGTELTPEKAERARANLREAGLAKFAEIRVGDALQSLKDLTKPVDLLFLDGWKDLYVPVLDLAYPALRPGALVLADNIATFPDELAPYMAKVNDEYGPYRSVLVPFESGLGYSVVRGDSDNADAWPPARAGILAGIARKSKRHAPVETLEQVDITAHQGLTGDSRGRFADRAVTVLAKEGWAAAMAELGLPPDTDWTLRRANLLTEGIELPRAPGGVIGVGDVLLEVTGELNPCSRMEEQQSGLLKALSPDWRGGVTCRVLKEGHIKKGDSVQTLISPPARARPNLPG